MTEQKSFLNATEFSQATGIPAATITKLLRDGKISGQKKSGKWAIPDSELEAPVVLDLSGKEPAQPEASLMAPASLKTYSVAEFSKMTYLTEKGILDWMKKGRLTGRKTSQGDWQIDDTNLDDPNIKRLVRESR